MGVLDLLLPERCAGCGIEGVSLCEACYARVVVLRGPLCNRCGAPVEWPVERCRECAGRRLAFARARAAVAYEGPIVRFVAAWKEGGRRCLAALAAELIEAALDRPGVDAVSFVPASSDRALWRGHNPAERLARELAAAWDLPALGLLERRAAPRRQRGLRLAERRRNVSGAFRTTRTSPSRVLLVDDVYTSGATVAACATALRRSGSATVEVVTFARALRDVELLRPRSGRLREVPRS